MTSEKLSELFAKVTDARDKGWNFSCRFDPQYPWVEFANSMLEATPVNPLPVVAMFSVREQNPPKYIKPHCEYIDGYYFGTMIIAEDGEVFDNINAAKERYGDDLRIVVYREHECMHRYYYRCYHNEEFNCGVVVETRIVVHTDFDIEQNSSVIGILTKDKHFFDRSGCRGAKAMRPEDFSDSYVDGLVDVVTKLFDLHSCIVNINANNYMVLDNMKNVAKFLVASNKSMGKTAKVSKKLQSMLDKTNVKVVPNPNRHLSEIKHLTCATHVNKIEDGLCVIRWTYSYDNIAFDGMRIYLSGKDTYACKLNNEGQFVPVKWQNYNGKNFDAEYSTQLTIDDMTGTRLEWYASLVDQIPTSKRIKAMLLFVSDPKMEQLAKMGLCEFVCDKLHDNDVNVSADIREQLLISTEEEDSKNIYRWIGLNNYQFNAVKREAAKMDLKAFGQLVSFVKRTFHETDISPYDNDTFDRILNAICGNINWNDRYGSCAPVLQNIIQLTERNHAGDFKKNMLRYLPKLISICQSHYYSYLKYHDYINMVFAMGIDKSINLYPDNMDQITTMHDSVVAAFNMQKDSYAKTMFKNRVNEIRRFEYDCDKFEFCVKTPEEPEDLAVEGLGLHHCVKSYIERVSNGETNILFIRKKSEPEKPFFTVELTNNGTIAQVHGFANRNASTEPNMVEFVKKWANAKKLRLGYYNEVR